MNKKIKIIDLIDKIYHKNNIPKKIKIGENIYFYDYDMGYYRKSDEEYNLRVYLTEDLGLDVYEDLVREVEILEDNTEEIEELEKEQEAIGNPKTLRQEIRLYYDSNKMGDKINELVKAINEIRKDLNK